MAERENTWVKVEKGIRYREHPNRMHNKRPDRYYVIRYSVHGKKKQEALGWGSEGVTLDKARLILTKLKEANRTGIGPATLAEHREVAEEKRATLAREKAETQKSAITVGHYWEHFYWPAQAHKAEGSKVAENALWNNWLKPELEQIPLLQVSPSHLDTIKLNMLEKKMSPASIKYAMAVISQIWTMAQRDQIVETASPTKRISLPKKDNRRQRYLTKKEASQLLANLLDVSQTCHDMSILALDCGLRFGEIAKLTWYDCNFESERIFIKDPKSFNNRFAFMTPRVKELLQKLKEKACDSGLIFRTSAGTLFDRVPKPFRRVADELFNEAVVDPRMRVCFHTLRHTFASWLVEGGISLYMVKELMGHSDFSMTQRYSHLSPEALRTAIETLSERK